MSINSPQHRRRQRPDRHFCLHMCSFSLLYRLCRVPSCTQSPNNPGREGVPAGVAASKLVARLTATTIVRVLPFLLTRETGVRPAAECSTVTSTWWTDVDCDASPEVKRSNKIALVVAFSIRMGKTRRVRGRGALVKANPGTKLYLRLQTRRVQYHPEAFSQLNTASWRPAPAPTHLPLQCHHSTGQSHPRRLSLQTEERWSST